LLERPRGQATGWRYPLEPAEVRVGSGGHATLGANERLFGNKHPFLLPDREISLAHCQVVVDTFPNGKLNKP
jgi:hypothetical protein